MKVETIQHNGLTIEIHTDDDSESPRTAYDNLGTILYTSDRYTLGDKRVDRDEIQEIMARPDVVWLPVYAYIHSGITISTGAFSDPWDSGMCGIIYVERDNILREWNRTRMTKKLAEKVKALLNSEIEVYDQFLQGEVYGYEVKKIVDCPHCNHPEEEVLDSCWGFYGLDYCIEEAKSIAESHEKRRAG